MEKSFIAFVENSIKEHWDLDALTDYKGATLQYKDVARKIEKLHILLAEDNELNMEIAEFMLQNEGADVTKAWNGQEAVELFEKSRAGEFDVILMDIMMPVMNGYDATKTIRSLDREDAKEVPIIAMTANAFEEDKRDAIAAGMDGHIAKPIQVDKLLSMLAEMIRQQETH